MGRGKNHLAEEMAKTLTFTICITLVGNFHELLFIPVLLLSLHSPTSGCAGQILFSSHPDLRRKHSEFILIHLSTTYFPIRLVGCKAVILSLSTFYA
jgi:hypothetical protein